MAIVNMALPWQAVVLLLHSVLFINCLPTEKILSDINEDYQPQINSILDYLNRNPERIYNHNFGHLINAQKKTEEVTDLVIDVDVECLYNDVCPGKILTCRAYVEYFPDGNNYEALPGVACQVKNYDLEEESTVTDVYMQGQNQEAVEYAEESPEVPEQPFVEQHKPCTGCMTDLKPDAEGIDVLVNTAVNHIESERGRKYLVQVLRLQSQVILGVKYVLLLQITPTECPNNLDVINTEMCPVDTHSPAETCEITYLQQPWINRDKNIIANNCTKSQEFATSKIDNRNDFDNEIDVNNAYQKPEDQNMQEITDSSPNFDKMAETGYFDDFLTPEKIAEIQSQLIPTDSTKKEILVEATKSGVDNTQLGVEDIPSLQTSTDSFYQGGNNDQVTEDLKMESADEDKVSTDDTEEKIKDDSVSSEDKEQREKREVPHSDESKSSEEATATPVRKKRAAPKSSEESNETSEEVTTKGETAPLRKRREATSSSSEESDETKAKPETLKKKEDVVPATEEVRRRRQAPTSQSSEESDESKEKKNQELPVRRKRNTSVSSEESDESHEVKNKEPVAKPTEEARKKRDLSSQSSEDSDMDDEIAAKTIDAEEMNSEHEISKRAADNNDSSSSSSSSSEEDKKSKKQDDNNDDDDNGNNNHVKSQKLRRSENDDDDNNHDNVKTSKKVSKKDDNDKNQDDDNDKKKADSSSSSSSSSDDDDDDNKKRNKRGAKDSSSSSSSSSDDDDDDNNNNDNDNNNHHHNKEDHKKNTKKASSKKANKDTNDKDDTSSSSSSSSDDDDNNNNNNNNRRRRGADYKDSNKYINSLAEFAATSMETGNTKYDVLKVIKSKKIELEGTVYVISMQVLVSNCEDLKTCMPKNQLFCNVRFHVSKTAKPKLLSSRCKYDKKIIKRSVALGAPTDAKNDDGIKDLAKFTLVQLDSKSSHSNKYKVVKILEATKQVVAGSAYKIKAEIVVSDCPKTSDKDSELCSELKGANSKICKIDIWDRPWLPNGRKTDVVCESETFTFTTTSPKKADSRKKRDIVGGVVDASEDEEIKKLIKSTLQQLDTKSSHENKYIFTKILEATQQVVNGILYRIKTEISVSDCAKNSNIDTENCGVLRDSKPKICHFKILDKAWLADGRKTDVTCDSETFTFISDSRRPKRSLQKPYIPGGEYDATEDENIKTLTKATLQQLDAESKHENKYKIYEIVEAVKQVVAGMLYKIKAKIIVSDCAKTSETDSELCGTLKETNPKTCHIRIYDRPWEPNARQTNVTCDENEEFYFISDSSRPKRALERPRIAGGEHDATHDENIKALTKSTLQQLDAESTHQNKYKIHEIIKAVKQVVSGMLYKIKAKIIVSDCAKTSKTDSELCGSLKESTPKTCHIKIWDQPWLPNGRKTNVTCDENENFYFEIDSPRPKRSLVGGPIDATQDEEILSLTKTSLLQLDAEESTHQNKYKINKILDAVKQVVSGILYKIKAEVIVSDCPKSSNTDSDLCGVLTESKPKICKIEIWDQPWLVDGRKTTINCDKPKLLGQDDHDIHYSEFKQFMVEHNKVYRNKEEMTYRLKVFKANMQRAQVLNNNEQGTATYGATKFADLTIEEFKMRLGYRPDLRNGNDIGFAQAEIPNIDLPTEFDWRKKGVVTEVKDQGQCGSCWAFSVTGNVEGQYAKKYGKLLEFSEQELVDCDKTDEGCNGGLMDNAYRVIEQMGGLESEQDYPYDAEDETCHLNKTLIKVQLSGAVNISQDETEMAKWLVKNGPISIAINANAMQLYRGGVSHPYKVLCNPNDLDHGVLIVGYGIHKYPIFKKTLPYWIVKNSWGPSWGEQGYYRVYRGDGTCGLNKTPSSAIVE